MAGGSDALNAARKALQVAAQPSSGKDEKRSFIDALLALPKDESIEAKQFFVTLLPKYFADFEDLQNDQLDGLLDLCEHEDEQVRILGIKGLATVAKADKRWAKGNVNVLLQLLECPPAELKVVKQTLLSLLSFATTETLDVMLTDCSEAEDQTGIPRLNILKFLSNDAADFRREVLSTGRQKDLEELFFDGLVGVLEDTTLQETRIIIDMLSSLAIVRGKGADRKRLDKFVRALTTSLKADSSTGSSLPHINTFAAVTAGKSAKGKEAELDGRSALDFLASHGGAVVDLGLTKKDETAQGILKNVYGWVEGAEKAWRDGKDSGDKVARGVVETMLDEILRWSRDIKEKDLDKQADILERILFPIYELVVERSRKDLIRNGIVNKLKDLGDAANGAYKTEGKQSVQGRRLRNIRDITDYLSDDKASKLDLTPTWLEAPAPLRPAAAPARAPLPPARDPGPANTRVPVPTPISRREPLPQQRYPQNPHQGGNQSVPTMSARDVPPHVASAARRDVDLRRRDDARDSWRDRQSDRNHVGRPGVPSAPSRSINMRDRNGPQRSPSPVRRDDRDRGRHEAEAGRRDDRDLHPSRNGREGGRYHDRPKSPARPADKKEQSPDVSRNGGDRPRKDAAHRSPKHQRSPSPRREPASSAPAPSKAPAPRAASPESVARQASPPSAATRKDMRPATSILGRSGSSRGIELLGPPGDQDASGQVAVVPSGSSRGVELLQSKPSPSQGSVPGSSRGVELLQPKSAPVPAPAQPAAIAPGKLSTPSSSAPAHATPFSIRNSASAKRAREEEQASSAAADTFSSPAQSAPISLLSRLSRSSGKTPGSSDDSESASKRSRLSGGTQAESPATSNVKGRASLLSRIGSSTPSRPATPASPSPGPATSTPSGLSIRARASETPTRTGLSVLGRSSSGSIPSAAPLPPAQPAPRATEPIALAAPAATNAPVRRKGRGFEQQELTDIVIQPQSRVAAWNPTPSPKGPGSTFPQQQQQQLSAGVPSLQARLQGPAVRNGGKGTGNAVGSGIVRPAASLASRLGLGPP